MRRYLLPLWLGFACLPLVSDHPALAQQRRFLGPPHFRAFQDYERNGALTRVVLRNGLTILIEEHPSFPLASITTYVANQGLDAKQLAASRLLANTYQRSLEQSGEAYGLGAVFSTSTHPDGNLYNLTVPEKGVLKGIETQARLLMTPKVKEEEARRSLQELLNQSRTQTSTRRQQAEALLRDSSPALKAFLPRPQPDLLSGSENLSAWLESVHKATHRPEKTVLVISGSVFEERLLKKIVELYAPLPGSGQPYRPSAPSVAAWPQSLTWQQVRQGEDGHLVLAVLPTAGRRHGDFLPLQLMTYLLGAGRGSLLGRFAVTPQGGALEAHARLEADGSTGLLTIDIRPDPAQIDTAEVQALAQLEVLSRREPGPLQLVRAKALWLRDHYRGLERLEERARLLALGEMTGGYLQRDKLPQQIDKVSAADIQRVARTYLKTDRLSLLEYAPKDAEERRFTSRSFGETMKTLLPPAVEKQISDMNALAPSEGKAPEQPAKFEFQPGFVRTDLRRTSVLRGPEIFLQERHDVPLAHFGIFFPGGRRDEKGSAAGITELLVRCLLRGGGSGAGLPWEALESTGALLEVVNETDFFGFQATVLSPRKGAFLGIILDWLRQATFSGETVELERRRMLGRLAWQRADPLSDLSWARRQLFAGDPFGESRYGNPESLQTLTIESLQAWKKSHIDGLHPWILVRGDVNGTSFLQPFISKLSSGRLKTVRVGQRLGGEEDEYLDEDEDQQADASPAGDMVSSARDGFILLGFPGPARGSRDEWTLGVVENLLKGAGGRLERLLQEELPDHSARLRMLHDAAVSRGAIFVISRTDPSRQEQVLERLTGQMGRLKQAVIRPLDWNNARVLTITEFFRRQQSGAPFTLEMARNIVAGAGVRFEQSYLNTIRQARPADL
ncbi:MAG: insulinase family protein, partial [Acidobacteriota bacterium]